MRSLLTTIMLVLAQCVLSQNHIVVSKPNLRLYVISAEGDTLFTAAVSCGLNYGDKTRFGDKKTPEGVFTICSIEDASWWSHDFGDGAGARRGAYGPWFFRLRMPRFTSIGIHGTCFAESIGTRASEGCIRLRDDDIVALRQYVTVGMTCIITSDVIEDGTAGVRSSSDACEVRHFYE